MSRDSSFVLGSILTSPIEVESILQTLALGKASGPDTINNMILKELLKNCQLLYLNYSISSYI